MAEETQGGPKPRTVRYDAEGRIVRYEAPADGALAGVWVEVRALTTGGQLRALLSRTYWADIHEWSAGRVLSWGVPGERVVETVLPATATLPERTVTDVEPADVPPPAEAGIQAFSLVTLPGGDPVPLWNWIRACLVASATHRDGPDAPDVPAVPEPDVPGEAEVTDAGKASSGRSDATPAGTPSESSAEPSGMTATQTTTKTTKKSSRTSRGS